MNERVQLLAEESGMTQYVAAHNKYLERFAELIVRECVKEIENQYGGGRELADGTHSLDWDQAIECVAAFVRTNFGITT